jgi:hypothetical protein
LFFILVRLLGFQLYSLIEVTLDELRKMNDQDECSMVFQDVAFSPGLSTSVLPGRFRSSHGLPRINVQGDAPFAVRTVRMIACLQNQLILEDHVNGFCAELVRFLPVYRSRLKVVGLSI